MTVFGSLGEARWFKGHRIRASGREHGVKGAGWCGSRGVLVQDQMG